MNISNTQHVRRIMNEYFKHTTCTSIEETKTQNFYIYIDLLFLLRFA